MQSMMLPSPIAFDQSKVEKRFSTLDFFCFGLISSNDCVVSDNNTIISDIITSQNNHPMFCPCLMCAKNNEHKSNIDKSSDNCLVMFKHLKICRIF